MNAKSGYHFFFFNPVTSQDRTHHEYSKRCRAQCYRFFTSWPSVSSLITCVQLNLSMITIHFNYAEQRLDILKLIFPCRTDELDPVNKLNEGNSVW